MNNPGLSRALEIGGIIAGLVLIAFGAVAIFMGFDGRSTVQDNLANEFIVGTDDMNPTDIQKEIDDIILPSQENIAKERAAAGVEPLEFTPVEVPGCEVAGEPIDDGTKARCFAQYLRLHALRASSGLTYSQMGRYVASDDAPPEETDFAGGTSNAAYAEMDPQSSQPVANGSRELWVTATALSSALNLAYTAEQIALFGVVVGVALLLTGIGLVVLAVAVLHPRPTGTKAT